MAEALPLLGVVLTMVVTGVIVLVQQMSLRRQRAARARTMGTLASRYGWSWWPTHPPYTSTWRGKPFGVGGSRKALNVLAGTYRNRPVVVFDYEYVVSQGKSSQRYEHSVCGLMLPTPLPPLELTAERGTGWFRGRDLQLENEVFNDIYRITSEDDRYAMAVLHPRVMELLLANRMVWRIEGNALLTWSDGSASAEQLVWRVEVLSRLAELLPDHVLRDYGVPPTGSAGYPA